MKETQAQAIHRYLRAGNTITPLEALERFGCFRLAARIYDLRQLGVEIDEEFIRVGGKQVSRYRLRAPAKPVQVPLW